MNSGFFIHEDLTHTLIPQLTTILKDHFKSFFLFCLNSVPLFFFI